MKSFVRWLLAHLPRPVLQRLGSVGVPLLGLLYLGRGKECPVCGCRRRKFLPYGYVVSRDNALCPSCLSLERHRLLWLYLQRETSLFKGGDRVLHIAPEVSLMKPLRRLYEKSCGDYVTADLESPLADLHFDVQAIPIEDNSFDVIICNHILEHVESDRLALSELYRVMRPNGWGVLLSPVDQERESTFEDDSIVDEAERTRIFGQYDHRRIYGRDYAERLAEVGFVVESIDYLSTLPVAERELFALSDEVIYVVSK